MATIDLVSASIVITLFMLGLHDFVIKIEENKCKMTYMYEYPKYQKIPMVNGVVNSSQFHRYALYAYCEGHYCNNIKHTRQFTGIPVLYIPGNAGSYKQVRSFASVALRMSESRKTNFHYDFFTVDLQEELLALHGPTLQTAIDFTALCLKNIQRLYSASNEDVSVVLIGHSMGGVIARSLYLNPTSPNLSITTIITLGTPHLQPVLSLDSHLASIYEGLNSQWANVSQRVNIVSIAGGGRDRLVRPFYSDLSQISDVSRSISVVSTAVPTVWASADHLCLVWCKQLVLQLVRALFDIVDTSNNRLHTDTAYKQTVFEHHLIKNPGSTHHSTFQHSRTLSEVTQFGEAVVVSDNHYVIKQKFSKPRHILVKLNDMSADKLEVLTNMPVAHWLYIGGESNGTSHVVSISSQGQYLPSSASSLPQYDVDLDLLYKYINIDVGREKNGSIIIYLPPRKQLYVAMYLYRAETRGATVSHLPPLYNPFLQHLIRLDPHSTADERGIRHNITLQGLSFMWQAYRVLVSATGCDQPSPDDVAVIELDVPWYNQKVYHTLTLAGEADMPLRLQAPVREGDGLVHVNIYRVREECGVDVYVKVDYAGVFGQIAAHYSVLIPNYMLLNVLLVLMYQVKAQTTEDKDVSFERILVAQSKPFKVLIPVALLMSLYRFAVTCGVRWLPPAPDFVFSSSHYSFISLRIFLFMVSNALVLIMSWILIRAPITLLSSLFHVIMNRWKWRLTILSQGAWLYAILCSAVMAATFTWAPAVAHFMATCIYVILLTHIKCVSYVCDVSRTRKLLHFYSILHTLFFLHLFQAACYLPSLLTYLNYNSEISKTDNLTLVLMSLVVLMVISTVTTLRQPLHISFCQSEVVQKLEKFHILPVILYVITLASGLYSLASLHRIPHTILLVTCIVAAYLLAHVDDLKRDTGNTKKDL